MRLKTYIVDSEVLLEQAISLIARLDDDVFCALTPMSPRGSIGGHLRHVVNFYQSFLNGYQEGQVDYNNRERDARFERDRLYALRCIEEVSRRLKGLAGVNANEHLLVSVEDDSAWSRSSVLRELDFLKSHTIHHYSLVAMLLRLHEIEPGEEFGVAPATLKHWKQESLCAQ